MEDGFLPFPDPSDRSSSHFFTCEWPRQRKFNSEINVGSNCILETQRYQGSGPSDLFLHHLAM